ncbi:MAG: DUF4340 domain-containing protein [Firmicutes bacterium]|nr:DUF4340 domain-containing protein [Bacillota bacterium]
MKRVLTICICAVLLGGLAGTYFYMQKRNRDNPPSPSPTAKSSTLLIDKKIEDVESVVFTKGDTTLTLTQKLVPNADDPTKNDVAFTVNGNDSLPVVTATVNEMAAPCYYLTVYDKIVDKADDPSAYGFSPPQVRADVTYADGTSRTLSVGMQTPAQDYYYLMLSGDDAVYLLYPYSAQRLLRTLNDVVDKAIPAITNATLSYVEIANRGKEDIQFGFQGTAEEKQSYLDMAAQYASSGQSSGAALPLKLITPYPGRDVYAESFQALVLDGMSVTLGDIVEAGNSVTDIDTAKYGFDDPLLKLRLTDSDNDVNLIIGGDVPGEENTAYAMRAGQPVVYKIDKTSLTKFFNANVFSFMDKFVALPNISDCTGITIASKDKTYEAVIGHELVYDTSSPMPSPTGDATPAPTAAPQDIVHATFNGIPVEETMFKSYYRVVISLSFDASVREYTPDTPPDITITYHMSNGPDIVTEYYGYNNDFYAVRQAGQPLMFVINKRYLDILFQNSEQLIAGTYVTTK